MNGKKIVLLTTLIVFVVLIGLLAIFTRFVLNIDFGGEIQQSNSSAQVEEEPSDVDQADESESDQQPDQSQDKEQDKTEETTEDKEETEDKEASDEKSEDDEPEAYKASAQPKSAQITIQEDGEADYQLSVEDAQKLTELAGALDKLQLMSIQQSVGMQNPTWSASINLSLSDGTAVSCQLDQSTLSGSKTTLSTGSKTYESTVDIAAVKTLLQGWQEEDVKANAPAIATEEFAAATRLPAINTDAMVAQDIAGSSSQLQEALGKLKVTDTLSGSVNPGKMRSGISIVNLADDTSTLYTLEFYEDGILAYRTETNTEFYVCDKDSLNSFYATVDQISSKYSATPAYLALMDYDALYSAEVSSTTGGSRKKVGLIRDHAQNLFYFLQQIHVVNGKTKVESSMFNRPEYHADILFDSGTTISVDLSNGSLLVKGGDDVNRHYTLIGDENLDLLRAEFERVTED